MSQSRHPGPPGTDSHALRVAIIGAGPAGFYTAQQLFQTADIAVEVDMFDRLPTPFGLVRHGVAPDHQKIKSVVAVYDKIAKHPGFRFFGNVELGRDLTRSNLESHYHQIVCCTGAQTDRRLGIPGEDLAGSHPATEFVAWYNGHPDYSDLRFDLNCRTAVVVGVGNVAVDVARILCRTPEELGRTDIADYALEALRESRVERVYLLGRRGPAQAAFTNPEIKELGALDDADACTLAREVEIDPLTRAALDAAPDRSTERKLDILQGYALREGPRKSKQLILRFLVSPVEITAGEPGHVGGVLLARNELCADSGRGLRSRTTDDREALDAGLVFRSVGYRGVAVPGLPFDDAWGVIPNEQGRVLDPDRNGPLTGIFVAGWIKRGPSGVIGTNKPDAAETVRAMLEDLGAARLLRPAEPDPESIERRLQRSGVRFVTYADWLRLDAIETDRGRSAGRPRVKLTHHGSFTEALSG